MCLWFCKELDIWCCFQNVHRNSLWRSKSSKQQFGWWGTFTLFLFSDFMLVGFRSQSKLGLYAVAPVYCICLIIVVYFAALYRTSVLKDTMNNFFMWFCNDIFHNGLIVLDFVWPIFFICCGFRLQIFEVAVQIGHMQPTYMNWATLRLAT